MYAYIEICVYVYIHMFHPPIHHPLDCWGLSSVIGLRLIKELCTIIVDNNT